MKITIIYDNETYDGKLPPDWGFSCLIEAYGKHILFDTGAKGSLLLNNMKALKIAPQSIDEVFISHNHWDHTGGLLEFLKENGKVTIYVPTALQDVENTPNVVVINKLVELHEHIYSTGILNGIEQSLIIETQKGLVIIVGCSHPGIGMILDTAIKLGKPYAIIGGLHGFNQFELVRELQLICPTHCTKHISEIKAMYPDKYTQGGAGKVIEI